MARQQDQRKLAEWLQRLQRFEKSGLTIARFCARERVSVPTFWYWRRKCAGGDASPRAAPAAFKRGVLDIMPEASRPGRCWRLTLTSPY